MLLPDDYLHGISRNADETRPFLHFLVMLQARHNEVSKRFPCEAYLKQ
jgi:hypothetical protein